MALAGAVLEVKWGRFWTDRIVKITLSGSYPTGGETLDMTLFTNASGQDAGLQFGRPPDAAIALNDTGGRFFEVIPGTTLKNYKFKCYDTNGSELSAGAYPAGLSAPASPILIQITNKSLV